MDFSNIAMEFFNSRIDELYGDWKTYKFWRYLDELVGSRDRGAMCVSEISSPNALTLIKLELKHRHFPTIKVLVAMLNDAEGIAPEETDSLLARYQKQGLLKVDQRGVITLLDRKMLPVAELYVYEGEKWVLVARGDDEVQSRVDSVLREKNYAAFFLTSERTLENTLLYGRMDGIIISKGISQIIEAKFV